MSLTHISRAFERLLLGLLVVGGVAAHAQLPIARLSTVFPPGGKAGSTVEVTVTGGDLDDVARLVFSHSNIVAQPKPVGVDQKPEANKFIVTIGADTPAGVYEARVLGRFGISNPRAFVVGDHPEATVTTTNHGPEAAVSVLLNTVVNSRTDAGAVDYFKFTATKGQRVIIECQTRTIDSRMQDVLLVADTNGQELAHNRRGGLLDFIVPVDGDYLVEVHDITYRNGPEYFYRLTVSTAPHIDFVFPPSGLPGTTNQFTLYGRNLPGSSPATNRTVEGTPLEKLNVEIELPADRSSPQALTAGLTFPPAGAALDAKSYRLKTADEVSNPVLLDLANAPVVVEQEPNNTAEQAQRITLPCELVGQFYPAGDQDWVSFEAKKGDVYRIEVISHRLGLPTDPAVLVKQVTRNEKDEEKSAEVLELNDVDANIGGPEFNTATRDPVGRFEVKDDGTYRLRFRDLFNRFVNNPRLMYRLSLHRESPDFRLVALPQAPPPANKDTREALVWSPFLRRGETMPVKVLAFRRDGFNGPIQLSVEGLPAQVTAAPAQINPDKASALLFLTATTNAPGWSGPIRVVGKAKVGDAEIAREARIAAVTWTVADYNNEAVQSRVIGDLLLAVSDAESTPISVRPADTNIFEVSTDGKLQIPLVVERHGDFGENLKFKAAGSAALDSMKEFEVDGKTNAATLDLDLSQLKLPAGIHTFELQAQTKGKYRNNPDAAKEATDTAKQAAKELDKLRAEARRATDALAVAEKAADEASAQAQSVSEGDKATVDARANAASEAKMNAEKASAEATAKVKQAEEKKNELEKKAKELEEKAKPRDVTITVYSAPITVQVKEEAKK